MPKRKQPENRDAEAADALDVETLEAALSPELETRRDELGRFVKGCSGNPGGVPKAAIELRRAALEYAPEALMRATALMRRANAQAASAGIQHVLDRALGKVGSALELPESAEAPSLTDGSPAALLSLALSGTAAVVAHYVARQKAGHALTPDEAGQLGDASRTLAALAKEERELEKASAAGKLSDAALQAQVLAAVSREVLEQELARRTTPEAA